jgi:exonuclease SbcC
MEGLEKNYAQAEKIKEQYGIVKDLDDLANGNNARRLVLEQYVLAGYFENILKAANLRLKNMTDGRYELLRAGQVSDGRKKDNLEIEVMDYYTGRKRSVKTLSGGETFKASLAMALGMSDCIQAESGGMEIETLFIDEGFGALDEESLEQACETLQSLAGKNRMVGVISHVVQLRERIEHQIIIEKRNNGSYVKIV